MRAHPVQALNLIQDSTRHRWHEATATKTALGPSAIYDRLRSLGLLAQGRTVQRDSIKQLLPRFGPPLRPAKTRLRAAMAASSGVPLVFQSQLGAVLCQYRIRPV
jgi:hypothetical protein